jgi:hypothetical protein
MKKLKIEIANNDIKQMIEEMHYKVMLNMA